MEETREKFGDEYKTLFRKEDLCDDVIKYMSIYVLLFFFLRFSGFGLDLLYFVREIFLSFCFRFFWRKSLGDSDDSDKEKEF